MNHDDDLPQELECGVCMEVYKDPKTLPCIHTFCKICIARHIISQRQQHERVKGFLCPLCRFFVRVPRSDQPLEQWASQLPNNTQIPHIIEVWKKRMATVNTMCKYHPEENLTSFCKICNCCACSKCLRERHPTCTGDAFCTVKEIADKRKHKMQNGIRELDFEVRRMTDNVDLVKTVMSGLKEAKSSLVSDIRDHANLCIKTVAKEESELLDKLDSAVEEQLRSLRLTKNPVDEASDILRHYKAEIDTLMKSSTGLTFMDNLELAKERHRECMEMIQRLQTQCRPPTITLIETESRLSPSIGTLVSSSLTTDVSLNASMSPSNPDQSNQTGSVVPSERDQSHHTHM